MSICDSCFCEKCASFNSPKKANTFMFGRKLIKI